MKISLCSINDLPLVAEKLLSSYPQYRVFAFYGKMGAGKTTLIKAICEYLGSTDNVTSPTFALINEYTTSGNLLIYHFDFYRIKNIQEAYDLGYEDYFFSGNYCFIEWPENIEQLLPLNTVKVNIQVEANDDRQLEVEVV